MSILIPGMEMPKDGYIDVRLFSDGCAYIQTGEPPYYRAFKAIELPPHGRLGDLDALMAEFERMQTLYERRGHEFACSFMSSSMEISTEWYCVEDAVSAAETIIPAEPEKEDESWN